MPGSETRFAVLEDGRRIWAISGVYGKIDRMTLLHETIASDITENDYFIYLGNLIGSGGHNAEVFAGVLNFRRFISEHLPKDTEDRFIFLRGSQEEMWHKLLRLHMAHKPEEVYNFLMEQGMDAMLESYGFSKEEGMQAINCGTVALSHWTEKLRDAFYQSPGYTEVFNNLKHAAYRDDKRLLFVNSGINHEKTLEQHTDEFWWAAGNAFNREKPYGGFKAVVRGHAKGFKQGIYNDDCYITLGSGEGPEGSVYAGLFNKDGQLTKAVEI